MKKFPDLIITLIISIALFISDEHATFCQTPDREAVTLSESGWTITADPGRGRLTISHDSLGILLDDVMISAGNMSDPRPISHWKSLKKEESRIEFQTEDPATAWKFEVKSGNLIISSTSSDLYLTAKAPAPAGRMPVHLLDQLGVPVTWRGTTEVTVSWNGKDTQNPSALPSRNPEVMTFALGQVSSTNLHSLFDRKSDIAVNFSDMTMVKRDHQNQEQLDLIIPVPGRTFIRLIPEYYTRVLGLPVYSHFDDTSFPSAPLIWGSWTAYYSEVRESDIISNADWLSENLKPYGFQYVQLDDGYDRGKNGEHYWIENWDRTKFPHGPEWLAGYIRSKGFKPGLWIVPNSYAGFFKEHPDWYLYDRSGKVIKDYSTPALDQTNPAVREWLGKLFTTLTGWGFEYFKFDGELSLPLNIPDVDKSRIYNKSIDPFTAYRERLKLIRSVIGPRTFIEGCVAGTPLNGVGYFNSCFNGDDMYNSWKGSYAVFSSINANAFLNHMVLYVMPGEGIDVSPPMSPEEAKLKMNPAAIQVALTREDPFTGFGTTLAEARTLVTVISLTGVAYPLTSIMPGLPEERVRLLKMTMPTLPVMPLDLFSRGSDITWDKFKHTTPDTYIHDYPQIIDLKVNAITGVYDVAAFTNWLGEKELKKVSLTGKLGLDKGTQFVIFDFWNQKLLGVFRDSVDLEIEPHDTRVLLIHPLQEHPQLIGNSRHISGICSILDLKWDGARNILKGSSEIIKGAPYTLFIYIPEGTSLEKANAVTKENSEVKLNSVLSGNLLKISMEGQSGSVSWQLQFRK